MGLTYKDSGVDITAGNQVVKNIKAEVQSTFGPEVLTNYGGFAGLFAPDIAKYKQPVLVSGTDGVGTKLKIAFMMDNHQTVGTDLVAMCVNDILAQGARPLFFLDYLASGKIKPDQVTDIIKGITAGCKQSGCALLGGETAEMPGFYRESEYDLAGFAVGLVDKEKIITGQRITPGDKILGLPSTGLHSNGFSLVRKVFFEVAEYSVFDQIDGIENKLGYELLKPTRIYVKPVLKLVNNYDIKGIAHITGGGLIENIPRILPDEMTAHLMETAWPKPPIFNLIKKLGKIELKEMYQTFNMGIGMVLIISANEVDKVINSLMEMGEEAFLIGEIKQGRKEVKIG